MTQKFTTTIGLATLLALVNPRLTKAWQVSDRPNAIGHSQLEGVLTCTLDAPELSGDAQVDRWSRSEYEKRLDRVVRLTLKDEGRAAVVSAPLAPGSVPFDILFVANRNIFNLFIEQNPLSSSVYAVSRGVPGILGEMVHMSAASDGFATTSARGPHGRTGNAGGNQVRHMGHALWSNAGQHPLAQTEAAR